MSAVEISDAAAHEATPSEATAAAPPPDDGTRLSNERPFPGLRPFGFADRGFFFGRERQAFALYRLVENGRFIAVIGGSGSGKSSLVLGGLQGLLADETADSGGPTWAFSTCGPAALRSRASRAPCRNCRRRTARMRQRDDVTVSNGHCDSRASASRARSLKRAA